MAYACHDLPLPCGPDKQCITWHIVNRMWILSDSEDQHHADTAARRLVQPTTTAAPWTSPAAAAAAATSRHFEDDDVQTFSSKLLAYPLLREITRRLLDMASYRTRKTAANFVLFSGHDKTVSTVARALGVYDHRWPPYGSRLVFELHASASQHRPRYFFRLLYNGADVTSRLAFCPPSDRVAGQLCPLDNVAYKMFDRFQTTGKKTHAQACA